MTSYSLTPCTSKSASQEVSLESSQGTEDLDDAESFNEEDWFIAEGVADSDEDPYEGAFAHYSRKPARSSASSQKLAQSVQKHYQRGILTELNFQRVSGSHDGRSSSQPHIKAMVANAKDSSKRARRLKNSPLSKRENLLAQAWERKRGLWRSEMSASFSETQLPEFLRRSCSSLGDENMKGSCRQEERSLRVRSLTDDDFDELRGCIDLNFRFDQSAVPDLCKTLPALEVYCAVAQSFHESPKSYSPITKSPNGFSSPSAIPSWRVASPGDDPNVVKGKLRHWAQAVACHVRLCH